MTMRCYIHTDREASGTCVKCGRPICDECKVEVGSKYHCKSCVRDMAERGGKAYQQALGFGQEKSPGVAAVLSFFWAGLGQIYNGQIGKGVGFIITYTISALLMFVLIGFVTTPILWILGMVDAYRSAEKINKKAHMAPTPASSGAVTSKETDLLLKKGAGFSQPTPAPAGPAVTPEREQPDPLQQETAERRRAAEEYRKKQAENEMDPSKKSGETAMDGRKANVVIQGPEVIVSKVNFCPECGEKVHADDKFCQHCGKSLR